MRKRSSNFRASRFFLFFSVFVHGDNCIFSLSAGSFQPGGGELSPLRGVSGKISLLSFLESSGHPKIDLQFIQFSAILFLAHHILVFDEARGYFPYARGTMVFCQSHPISQKLQRAIAIYADMKEKLSEFCNLTRIQLLPY